MRLGAQVGLSRPVRIAVADVDGDGAEDILVQRFIGAGIPGDGLTLFHNDTVVKHWIKVNLVGRTIKSALGSTIAVYEAGHLGDPAYLRGSRQVLASTSHRQPREQHFGVEDGKTYDVRTVFWPSRKVVDVASVTPGKAITVME